MFGLDTFDWYEADAEILAVKERIEAQIPAFADEIEAIQNEVGAIGCAHRGSYVAGLIFDNNAAPENWADKGTVNGKRFFLPKATSKDRKALRKRISALRKPVMSDFGDAFGGRAIMEPTDGGAFAMRGPIFEAAGSRVFFGVPKGYPSKQLKKDVSALRPVPLSELYAAKEAAEAA
tara:strand:- start:402 stop:932 length:531 start_codon:yes stop_codon:yes gene_type:complete